MNIEKMSTSNVDEIKKNKIKQKGGGLAFGLRHKKRDGARCACSASERISLSAMIYFTSTPVRV